MLRRKNKPAVIDLTNVFIKEFKSNRYFFKVTFLGNIKIKSKLQKDLMFYRTDKTTVVYGFSENFKIEEFVKRVNKILKTQ